MSAKIPGGFVIIGYGASKNQRVVGSNYAQTIKMSSIELNAGI